MASMGRYVLLADDGNHLLNSIEIPHTVPPKVVNTAAVKYVIVRADNATGIENDICGRPYGLP